MRQAGGPPKSQGGSAAAAASTRDAAPADPLQSAQSAGLRYVADTTPGIRRRRSGRGFTYIGPDGSAVRDAEQRRRIASLAIPPAWRDVWICPIPNGHIQATGRDARGRKQYRYHPRWQAARDESKYGRMIAFGEALPAIREGTAAHLSLPGLPREKVLATVVRLLDTTLIRVGNEEYARTNGSVGLTTMRDEHVTVVGATLRFQFRGKSGIEHSVDLRDRRLARLVKRCQDLPGDELFQYLDDNGVQRTIDSGDVNDYLRALTGQDFSAKDFRTWAGTVLAAQALLTVPELADAEISAKQIAPAVKQVARRLGNTPAVCRQCYIHPEVLAAFFDGSLAEELSSGRQAPSDESHLRTEEAAVLALLKRRSAA